MVNGRSRRRDIDNARRRRAHASAIETGADSAMPTARDGIWLLPSSMFVAACPSVVAVRRCLSSVSCRPFWFQRSASRVRVVSANAEQVFSASVRVACKVAVQAQRWCSIGNERWCSSARQR